MLSEKKIDEILSDHDSYHFLLSIPGIKTRLETCCLNEMQLQALNNVLGVYLTDFVQRVFNDQDELKRESNQFSTVVYFLDRLLCAPFENEFLEELSKITNQEDPDKSIRHYFKALWLLLYKDQDTTRQPLLSLQGGDESAMNNDISWLVKEAVRVIHSKIASQFNNRVEFENILAAKQAALSQRSIQRSFITLDFDYLSWALSQMLSAINRIPMNGWVEIDGIAPQVKYHTAACKKVILELQADHIVKQYILAALKLSTIHTSQSVLNQQVVTMLASAEERPGGKPLNDQISHLSHYLNDHVTGGLASLDADLAHLQVTRRQLDAHDINTFMSVCRYLAPSLQGMRVVLEKTHALHEQSRKLIDTLIVARRAIDNAIVNGRLSATHVAREFYYHLGKLAVYTNAERFYVPTDDSSQLTEMMKALYGSQSVFNVVAEQYSFFVLLGFSQFSHSRNRNIIRNYEMFRPVYGYPWTPIANQSVAMSEDSGFSRDHVFLPYERGMIDRGRYLHPDVLLPMGIATQLQITKLIAEIQRSDLDRIAKTYISAVLDWQISGLLWLDEVAPYVKTKASASDLSILTDLLLGDSRMLPGASVPHLRFAAAQLKTHTEASLKQIYERICSHSIPVPFERFLALRASNVRHLENVIAARQALDQAVASRQLDSKEILRELYYYLGRLGGTMSAITCDTPMESSAFSQSMHVAGNPFNMRNNPRAFFIFVSLLSYKIIDSHGLPPHRTNGEYPWVSMPDGYQPSPMNLSALKQSLYTADEMRLLNAPQSSGLRTLFSIGAESLGAVQHRSSSTSTQAEENMTSMFNTLFSGASSQHRDPDDILEDMLNRTFGSNK